MGKRKEETTDLISVLVGPLTDAKTLSKWAHAYFKKNSAVCFVGVDRGLEPLYFSGLPVTIGIGDWDSLKNKKILKEVTTLGLKPEKDRSDFAVALEFSTKLGASEIIAIGFQGGRFDQELAVCIELSNVAVSVEKVTCIGPRGTYYFLSKPSQVFRERLRAGQILSILPLASVARGVHVQGLRFKPQDGILSLSSEGLSNVVTRPNVVISIQSGRVMVIVPQE